MHRNEYRVEGECFNRKMSNFMNQIHRVIDNHPEN